MPGRSLLSRSTMPALSAKRLTVVTIHWWVASGESLMTWAFVLHLAIEMGADAVDMGKTIHPHPTLGESIGMAAEAAHGSCTDLPPARK